MLFNTIKLDFYHKRYFNEKLYFKHTLTLWYIYFDRVPKVLCYHLQFKWLLCFHLYGGLPLKWMVFGAYYAYKIRCP